MPDPKDQNVYPRATAYDELRDDTRAYEHYLVTRWKGLQRVPEGAGAWEGLPTHVVEQLRKELIGVLHLVDRTLEKQTALKTVEETQKRLRAAAGLDKPASTTQGPMQGSPGGSGGSVGGTVGMIGAATSKITNCLPTPGPGYFDAADWQKMANDPRLGAAAHKSLVEQMYRAIVQPRLKVSTKDLIKDQYHSKDRP